MFNLDSYLTGGISLLAVAVVLWLISIVKKDVSIVDSFWSLMIMLAGIVFFINTTDLVARSYLVISLTVLWAIRLSAFISWRNWGEQEDYRYQQIRANNEPYFIYKSFYIVFVLQAALAWLVALPLLGAINSSNSLYWLDYAAITLWLIGMVFEVAGDHQLAQFKADAANKGKVMSQGLWRYSRHPNYFGEFCIWWGFFLFAAASGFWWSIISPIVMSVLLLKVSGVRLMESTINNRRPAYKTYCEQTSAFLPWLPKATAKTTSENISNIANKHSNDSAGSIS